MIYGLLLSSLPFSYYSIPAGMLGRGLVHYQRHAGDGVQRPLRFRFPPRLMPGVRRQGRRRKKPEQTLFGYLVRVDTICVKTQRRRGPWRPWQTVSRLSKRS
jgi:hypothetical protein